MLHKSMIWASLAFVLVMPQRTIAAEMAMGDPMNGDHASMATEMGSMMHDGGPAGADEETMGKGHDAMMHEGMKEQSAGGEMHSGRGVVRGIDPVHGMVSIAHEPIPSLGWPKMRMNFETVEGLDLSAIREGDTVSFTLQVDDNGDYKVCEIATVE